MNSISIGSVTLKNNLILGPMAGVSDLPFRVLCAREGAGMCCMEMVSAKAIYYNNKNTEKLMAISPEEGDVSLQLFGNEPDLMAEIAKKIEERPFSVLDINMGCPVPKVVKNGEGSALMKDPVLAGKIVEAIVKAIKKPVTAKIRAGFDEEHKNAVEVAKVLEASGAAAICVHGRTREQYYSGKADYGIIAEVKNAVKIPVIGNGDIRSYKDVLRMKEETGCDGFMISRAAEGNPWIFKEILHYFETGEELPRPDFDTIKETILLQARMEIEAKGEYTAIREMRRHSAYYTAGLPDSAKLRGKLSEVKTYDELLALLTKNDK